MTVVSGTQLTYDVGSGGGIREDLEDVIYDLFPADTYLYSNLDSVTATNTFHEWLTDSLAAAAANRQVEGDDASYATLGAASRLGNYTQISRKTFLISGSLEAVKKAGRKSEIARIGMKKMREFKRDVEYALVGNQASSAGGNASGTARSSGGMESWIATTDNGGNGVRATTSASASTAGFSAGVVTAPTDGTTTGALTQAKLVEGIGLAWAQGGDVQTLLMDKTQKANFDTFAGVAALQNQVNNQPATVINVVELFKSDYGTHKAIIHRYMRANVVLGIDPEYWKVAWLQDRRPQMQTLAKTGDGEKRMIIGEFCLVAANPKSSMKAVACA